MSLIRLTLGSLLLRQVELLHDGMDGATGDAAPDRADRKRVFQECGLPDAMRTDNGVPFSSPWALYGLSKLSVWWLRLGIGLERIAPDIPSRTPGTSACT